MPVLSLLWCQLSVDRIRGPRIIAVAGNRGHLWGEQHRIETRTKRNHSWVNSGCLTIGGNYSRSPSVQCLACHLPPASQCSQAPAPVTDLRHVFAVFADVELVTLHGGP